MHRLVAVLVVMLLAGAVPASLAQAQIGPNVPEPLTEPPPPAPPAPNAFEDDGGLSTLQKVLIFGAAALVLGGIATVIVRDARKAAPPDERPRGARGSGAGGKAGAGAATAKSTAERKRQQRAKRAKAKHARQQRKRNRPQ